MINWRETLSIPPEAQLSEAAADLILRLCCGPDERLGGNGADQIKQHPFFSGLSFEGMRHRAAPYIPQIRYATDTSNFDPVDPEKLKQSCSCGESMDVFQDGAHENGRHPEHAFFEFTFRRFFDDGGHPYPRAAMATDSTDTEPDAAVYV